MLRRRTFIGMGQSRTMRPSCLRRRSTGTLRARHGTLRRAIVVHALVPLIACVMEKSGRCRRWLTGWHPSLAACPSWLMCEWCNMNNLYTAVVAALGSIRTAESDSCETSCEYMCARSTGALPLGVKIFGCQNISSSSFTTSTSTGHCPARGAVGARDSRWLFG